MGLVKVEKVTFEMRKSSADKLRRLRQRLREIDDLPVTQQMIVEHLINMATQDALRGHFAKLSTRLGLYEEQVQARRRADYRKRKRQKAGR